MDGNRGIEREGGMRSLRTSLAALAGTLLAATLVVGMAAPALAAPPYPTGDTATALVGGTPLLRAVCTVIAPVQATGTSTLGSIVVGGPAVAQCTGNSAQANGRYDLNGGTPTLRFSAQCINSTGTTTGLVDVPAGTFVPGIGVVTTTTTVTSNVTVTYPDGTMAVLNGVTTTGTSVTREAIHIISGPNNGAVIGRVTCGVGAPYPLSVDTGATGSAAPDLALTAVSGHHTSSNRTLYIAGAFALLILAQVAVGRSMWRRRREADGN